MGTSNLVPRTFSLFPNLKKGKSPGNEGVGTRLHCIQFPYNAKSMVIPDNLCAVNRSESYLEIQ